MHDERQAMQPAPDHERPRAAVPQSAEQHRDHDVARDEPPAPAIATQRNVKIIAQPGGKADVPAMPELRDVPREIRKVEVERQFVAEQSRAGNRHIRIPGEVAIDLDPVKENGEPRAARTIIRGGVEIFVHGRCDSVGDTGLLNKADEKENERAPPIDVRKNPERLELRQKLRRAHDRPGDHLRKEPDKARDLEDA